MAMIRRWLALTYYLYASPPCLIFILIHYKSNGLFQNQSSLHSKNKVQAAFSMLKLLFVRQSRFHKRFKQFVSSARIGREFRMELAGEEPRVVRNFNRFHQPFAS